ncbi:uncharacterized protein LOC129798249 [Phlebotomus papatasi]|uniref:uncharacterized protein LOC129798249 n=1 Tax=Phlebotomus papatasi TaxID=29031 RepID=UPI0024844448|nr:uncharacterized protein LOC129798249 [Phlebotomus papatasi]
MLRLIAAALFLIPAVLTEVNVQPCPQGNLPTVFELVSCSHGPCPPIIEDTVMTLRIGIRTNYITTRLPAYVVIIIDDVEETFPLEYGDACINIEGYCDPYLPAGEYYFKTRIMTAGVPVNKEFTVRIAIFDDNERSVACGQMPIIVEPRT